MSTVTDPRASSDQASRYLQEFYRDEAEKKRRYVAPRPKRSVAPLLAVITVPLFLSLTAYNIWGMRETGPAFTAAQDERAGRFAMYVVSRQVEGFREQHGRLPSHLSEVDPQERSVRYQTDGASYVLSYDTGARILVYQEGEDLTPYEEAAGGFLTGVGG